MLSLALAVGMLLSGMVAFAETSTDKLDQTLQGALEEERDSYPVYIGMKLIDVTPWDQAAFDVVIQGYLEKWGLEEKEFATTPSQARLTALWMLSIGKAEKDDSAIMMALELTKEEILRLAGFEEVAFIEYSYNLYSQIRFYDAQDALRILQASVDLIEATAGPEFDVNQDQTVNAVDALLALQSSVELIVISWPPNMMFPE